MLVVREQLPFGGTTEMGHEGAFWGSRNYLCADMSGTNVKIHQAIYTLNLCILLIYALLQKRVKHTCAHTHKYCPQRTTITFPGHLKRCLTNMNFSSLGMFRNFLLKIEPTDSEISNVIHISITVE